MTQVTTILAIETSCDETGVAVVQKNGETVRVLAEAVASQVDIHAVTGGVVPEVAAREHVQVIGPLLKKILIDAAKTGETPASLPVTGEGLTGVAVTVGPGLMPALSVGVNAARTLAYGWNIPVVPVHHLEGHIYSALVSSAGKEKNSSSQTVLTTNYTLPSADAYPVLALIVSGGHTMLILVTDTLHYEVIGTTRDDAAGEAFDKVARLLGLPYPGGPEISRVAAGGSSEAYHFTRPMLHSGDLDFSFSGLKTEVLYTVRKLSAEQLIAQRADLSASFQQAVVDTLVTKTMAAVKQRQPRSVVLAGGVAANALLRRQLAVAVAATNIRLCVAPLAWCGDNATMIGLVGVVAYQAGRTRTWHDLDAYARIPITDPLFT